MSLRAGGTLPQPVNVVSATIAELDLPGVAGFDGAAAAQRAALVRVVQFAARHAAALEQDGRIGMQAGEDLRLVLEELLTNVVRHAFRDLPGAEGRCRLLLDPESAVAIIEIEDNGPPFDPFDATNEAGYGLRLVRALARSYSWTLDGGQRNRLRVLLPLG